MQPTHEEKGIILTSPKTDFSDSFRLKYDSYEEFEIRFGDNLGLDLDITVKNKQSS